MNCKPGDLAYVVNADFKPLIGSVCEVLAESNNHPGLGFCWMVKFRSPMPCWHHYFQCEATSNTILIRDADLRPISGVPVDDETPIETNVPEALQLALGIQARVWA